MWFSHASIHNPVFAAMMMLVLRQLSAALSEELGNIFQASAIDPLPPVEIDVDEVSGELRLKGDRADKDRISALIDANPEVKRRIRDIAAISSHAIDLSERLQFQQDYRAASAPTAVGAKYARLFGPQESADLSLLFDGQDVHVLADGKPWISGTN